jgi:hypothetical protein
MGCPCREIRQVISHLPGVKHFLRLLPNLPNEGRSDMKMKTHPGRSIFVPSGNAYHADDKGIIHNVLGDDSYDLMRAGNIEQWFEPAPAAAPPPPPATPPAAPKAPPPVAPAAAAVPAKNDGPAAQ